MLAVIPFLSDLQDVRKPKALLFSFLKKFLGGESRFSASSCLSGLRSSSTFWFLPGSNPRQQQHLEVLNAAQETLERDQARDVAELTAHLEALAPRLVQVATDARNALASVQTRVESQVRQRDTLTQELQQEREARQVLSATLATQQEQLDDLRELVETLTKRKKA